MFNIVDTAFSYEREMIVCSILQDFSTGKGSSLQLICNAHTAFLLYGGALASLTTTFDSGFGLLAKTKLSFPQKTFKKEGTDV